MKRLEFLKLNILAGLGFNLFNFQAYDSSLPLFLTGKKKPELCSKSLLDKRAYEEFENMYNAALKDGIKIQIVSGYRNFNDQLRIWNRKYDRYKKQKLSEKDIFNIISSYSAIPGTSRHHWGTEIDIIDANAKRPTKGYLIHHNYQNGGVYSKLYNWMTEYAHNFGFYLVYTDNPSRNGFKFEPWHFSYEPLARRYLRQFSRLELTDNIKDDKIGGNDYLDKNCLLSYFHTHLLGINPLLLP